jgi:G3E family GTPase
MDAQVPVTVLTGFLGSGKTTLLNHILTATHGKKIAIIENEFGETAIDDKLLATNSKFSSDEEIIEVLNGCICCSVRQDLVRILQRLASRARAGELHLDAIVIETTGMADPAPVAQTFLVHDDLKAFARLDGIVTLVDAKHVERHLNATKPDGVVNEAVAQARLRAARTRRAHGLLLRCLFVQPSHACCV